MPPPPRPLPAACPVPTGWHCCRLSITPFWSQSTHPCELFILFTFFPKIIQADSSLPGSRHPPAHVESHIPKEEGRGAPEREARGAQEGHVVAPGLGCRD